MTTVLLILVGVPVLWLIGLVCYLLAWCDWDKKHSYIVK